MMSNNKILTVSYGTFSCTLEGFDDSFGTMKAIAEYFRDLAADDRYFGAEPPQPDAEMLTRIAEREISRRVEAREHEGRIVLSASDAKPAVQPTALAGAAALAARLKGDATTGVAEMPHTAALDTAAPDTAESDADTSQATAGIEAAIPAADDADASPDDIADVTATAETVAETDAVQPQAVAQTVEDDAADSVADSIDDAITDDADDSAEAFFATTDREVGVAASDTDADTDADDAEDLIIASVDVEDDIEQEDVVAEDVVAEVIVASAPAVADSIAAKLQRIRAVVSQSQQNAEEEELFEDEHAEDFDADETPFGSADMHVDADHDEDDETDVIAAAARDIEDAARIDDDAQAAMAEQDEEDDDDDIAAILARFDTDHDDSAVADVEPEDKVAPATDDDLADDDLGDDDLGLDTLAALMAADDGKADTDGSGENIFDQTDADDAPVAPRRARIVKVKRADIDAALASGQLEEVEDDDEDDIEGAAFEATSLSDQDEAELLAELAQVEAELPEGEAAKADAAMIVAPTAHTARDEAQAEVQDDDVSRLMAEADNQMDEPEGSSRRNAFAHLKAAVMAKKADADIGNDSIKDEGAFRSDLASVVKPRRPEAGSARAERPEGSRPAPLKLVAEQRVDLGAAPKGPVRPRRIAAVEEVETDAGADGSFADYAADMGAHNLPALLEAAASYLSFVEGRDQFSRPQLMNKVRQVEKDEFSREDGLRSFGQLLRAGKIEKMKGGRFAVTDDIGFRPDHRAAG